MSSEKEIELKLTIEAASEDSEEELESATQQLVSELNETNAVKNVAPKKTGNLPSGARAGELIAWGEIFITLMTSGGLVAVINTINSWIKGRRRNLKITKDGETKTVEASGLDKDQLDKIIEWMRK